MEIEEQFEWKLRLFLSADLVGSTAFKAHQDSLAPDWAPKFTDFFGEFPDEVESQYNHLSEKIARPPEKLQTWKFSGDEILFWVELKDVQDVLAHVWAFRKAVREFPQTAQWQADDKPKNRVPMTLKAAGWLAGFPVGNRELSLRGADGHTTLDFIGPMVDAGFRVAKFSTPRKFALTVELALMLVDAIEITKHDREDMQMRYDGRKDLKGVINNKPYPFVWLETAFDPNGIDAREDNLIGKPKCSHQDIGDFLERFIEETHGLHHPFIENCSHPRYRDIPEQFENIRKQMQPEETNRGFLADDKPPSGDETVVDDPTIPKDDQ